MELVEAVGEGARLRLPAEAPRRPVSAQAAGHEVAGQPPVGACRHGSGLLLHLRWLLLLLRLVLRLLLLASMLSLRVGFRRNFDTRAGRIKPRWGRRGCLVVDT